MSDEEQETKGIDTETMPSEPTEMMEEEANTETESSEEKPNETTMKKTDELPNGDTYNGTAETPSSDSPAEAEAETASSEAEDVVEETTENESAPVEKPNETTSEKSDEVLRDTVNIRGAAETSSTESPQVVETTLPLADPHQETEPTTVFPCVEQPLRVNLHCNGYYLWSLRKGRVIARKRRSDKDEFRISYQYNGALVEITNHKFGGKLSVAAVEDKEGGTVQHRVVCVKDKENDDEVEEANSNSNSGGDDDDDEEGEEEDFANVAINAQDSTEQDSQWCFVRGTHGQGVLLKSLRTGENLGIDGRGNIVFCSDNPTDPNVTSTWDIECVTGELLFISNPTVDARVRCDMAGLTSLTDSWKGWEVFRFMEAGHGYVKISSWMHSQWLLCSTSDGTVTTCSHAESFVEDSKKCSKWAIEKAPDDVKGVVIRSKSHGRILSVYEGTLKTYDPASEDGQGTDTEEESTAVSDESPSEGGKWWNTSMKNMQKRFSAATVKSKDGTKSFLPQKDTTVWQLEAAHSQTYYFISAPQGESTRSIGPFPQVSSNLRKTDKIRFIREADATRLFNPDKKQYIACSADGTIGYVNDADDDTDWIMEKPSYQEGGSVFRSKHHNRYLSYKDVEEEEDDDDKGDGKKGGHFDNLFGGRKEPELFGAETLGFREVWNLQPCMPRAVSSDKIKTFALGTSIAVGTTIAMPFALAGAGAVLGAFGAEAGILFNVIAVGLTGAEAIASVGAIGATAYIVFRPEENSLTDDHENEEEEEAERAWSKRPFSNWRNW